MYDDVASMSGRRYPHVETFNDTIRHSIEGRHDCPSSGRVSEMINVFDNEHYTLNADLEYLRMEINNNITTTNETTAAKEQVAAEEEPAASYETEAAADDDEIAVETEDASNNDFAPRESEIGRDIEMAEAVLTEDFSPNVEPAASYETETADDEQVDTNEDAAEEEPIASYETEAAADDDEISVETEDASNDDFAHRESEIGRDVEMAEAVLAEDFLPSDHIEPTPASEEMNEMEENEEMISRETEIGMSVSDYLDEDESSNLNESSIECEITEKHSTGGRSLAPLNYQHNTSSTSQQAPTA